MPKSTKFLVITSIFSPTEAVKKFAQVESWQLVVVGDKKTPVDWYSENVVYLGPEAQESLGFKLTSKLPWNHYCRKMVGYLYAMQQGAEIIADSDDDNIPYSDWPAIPEESTPQKTLSGSKFVNVYSYFTKENVWPRGYPLNQILNKEPLTEITSTKRVGVWQFLANEDPDVDAIYRLTNNQLITFDDNAPIVLDKGTASPFNSQNAVFKKEFFPLLYLPAFVTFRFTDILRGLVAQPVMWQHNYHLGFGKATVIQKRNPHDYIRDFESEIPVYLYAEKVVSCVSEHLANNTDSVNEQLMLAYKKLHELGIVTDDELQLLSLWDKDVQKVLTA